MVVVVIETCGPRQHHCALRSSVPLDYWLGMLPVASGHFYLEIKIYIDNYLALYLSNLPYGLNVQQVLMTH